MLRAVLLDGTATLEPLAELFVVCAARAQHVAEVIRPALTAGRTVLCDRFTDATLAYQGGGRGIEEHIVQRCCDYAAGGLVPQLTLLIDVLPELSRQRITTRTGVTGAAPDRLERENDAFHARVRARYLELARHEPERVKVLEGRLPGEAVLEQAWSHVARLV